jgi:hypothetical protein
VGSGYQIAGNGKTVVLGLSIKNRYDGIYELTLRHDGWQAYGIASGVADIYPADVHLITSGPNGVISNIPDLGLVLFFSQDGLVVSDILTIILLLEQQG